MLLRRFYLNLILRLSLILLNMLGMAFLAGHLISGQLLFTFVVVCGIMLSQIVLLFIYVKRTNRTLTRLVLSMANQDLTHAPRDSKSPHKELRLALKSIVEQYRSVYMEKESQSFLLQHLIQAIPVGVMLLDQDQEIVIQNTAFSKLLDLGYPVSLEELQKNHPGLHNIISMGKGRDGEVLSSGTRQKLSLTCREFLLLNRKHMIYLVQDISKEVDAGEVDTIRRLLRILTHEIMNSLTPVQSLTETISMLMKDPSGMPRKLEELSLENYNDILDSVLAIQERTSGLDHFVNHFRTLTRLPDSLERNHVAIDGLFDSVCRVLQGSFQGVKVLRHTESSTMSIQADRALIEQVLINLITNSLTAMSQQESPLLELKAFYDEHGMKMQVIDNGCGISEDKLTDIFMPFYSTKEKASGIGLSFVKQVLRLHDATIQVQSTPGEGSTFTILFPALPENII